MERDRAVPLSSRGTKEHRQTSSKDALHPTEDTGHRGLRGDQQIHQVNLTPALPLSLPPLPPALAVYSTGCAAHTEVRCFLT